MPNNLPINKVVMLRFQVETNGKISITAEPKKGTPAHNNALLAISVLHQLLGSANHRIATQTIDPHRDLHRVIDALIITPSEPVATTAPPTA